MLAKYFAFTSNALVDAVSLYGERLFKACRKKGVKIYIVEQALLSHPVAKMALSCGTEVLTKYWLDLHDAPPFGKTDELVVLSYLDQIHPDEIEIIVHNLYEYAWMNRNYANDEIFSVDSLLEFIKLAEEE